MRSVPPPNDSPTRGSQPEVQDATTCCYALQDKVWVNDPDGAPWEVYTVLADAPTEDGLGCSTACCGPVDAGASTVCLCC